MVPSAARARKLDTQNFGAVRVLSAWLLVACVKRSPRSARLPLRDALGLDAARALYGKLLAVPAPGGDLYRVALRIEEAAAGMPPASSSGSGAAAVVPAVVALPKAAAKRVTDLYEAAVAAYGRSEADLWIGYARWVVAGGKGAGKVYWRATKELAEPDGFVAAYREAIGQQ